jgi:hypothetical protein
MRTTATEAMRPGDRLDLPDSGRSLLVLEARRFGVGWFTGWSNLLGVLATGGSAGSAFSSAPTTRERKGRPRTTPPLRSQQGCAGFFEERASAFAA